MVPERRKVIIIGAGFGGLALAHGLKKRGVPFVVYERDATKMAGLHGYRVGISVDGSHALQELLSPDLFTMFDKTSAREPEYFFIFDERFRRLLKLGVGVDEATPVEDREHSVSRPILRQVLLVSLDGDYEETQLAKARLQYPKSDLEEGSEVRFGKTFERYEEDGDGPITVYFSDGSTDTGHVLIGADGANSLVRKQRLPQAQVVDTNIISLAAKYELDEEARHLMPKDVDRSVTLINGPRGSGGIIHTLYFSDRDDLVETLTEQQRSKYASNDSDSLLSRCEPSMKDWAHWAIWASADKFPSDILAKRNADIAAAALDLAQELGYCKDFQRLIEKSIPESAFPIAIRTSEPLKEAWQPSRVTLLGDAVHTMTPGRGVGANTALRDALALSQALGEGWSQTTPELISSIGSYESTMRSYAYPAVLASRRMMDGRSFIHRRPYFLGWISNQLFRIVLRLADVLLPLRTLYARILQRDRGHERARQRRREKAKRA